MKMKDLIKEIETLQGFYEQVYGYTDGFLEREVNINGIVFDQNLGHNGMYVVY